MSEAAIHISGVARIFPSEGAHLPSYDKEINKITYRNNYTSYQYTWSNFTEILLHEVGPDGIIYYNK